MADEIVTTTEQTAEQPAQTVQTAQTTETAQQPVQKEDLISRATKKQEVKQETNPFNLTKEDYDKVQSDPTLSKFYKSMQSGYIKKTQEVAEERKKISQPQSWTTERLQQEMNKPDFIQAAQPLLQNPQGSGLTNEEYSTLTQTEKAQLTESIQRSRNLEGQLWQMQQKAQDDQLSKIYGNYNPQVVDSTIQKLVKGEIKADREVIYKALYHDENVKNAYELGKQDALSGLKEKQQASSPEGFSATPLSEVPVKLPKESDRAYFKRLGERRLAEQKGLNR